MSPRTESVIRTAAIACEQALHAADKADHQHATILAAFWRRRAQAWSQQAFTAALGAP